MEQWKDIKIENFEGVYQINTVGNIKSLTKKDKSKNPIIMKSFIRGGYFSILLMKETKRKLFYIHRLIALTFINNPENKKYVNHIDGNKLNNKLENLEWCTASENIQHSLKNRLRIPQSGENHYKTSLTKTDIENIRNSYIRRIVTHKLLAKKYNVSESCIYGILNYKTWN